VVLCATATVSANTSFNLGAAGGFGIVMGSDAGSTSNSFSTNNGTINGLVGIESGGYFKSTGPGTILGVDFQDAVSDAGYTNGHAITSGQNLTGANNSVGNTAITNGLIQTAATLSSVATSISQLSTLANSSVAGGSHVNLDLAGNATATLTATETGTTVFDAGDGNVNIQNGSKISIVGGANSLVIINVSGTFNAQNNTAGDGVVLGCLSAGDCITADQIIWNITSTGNNFSSSGDYHTNIVYGDILDIAGSYNLNEITVDGRLFGANSDGGTRAGLSDQLVSNFALNAPIYTGAPEPSTWMAGLLGTGIIGFARLRRSKTSGAFQS